MLYKVYCQLLMVLWNRPTQPGIGVDLNDKAALKYPFEIADYVKWIHDDGGLAEW